jgi:hypothetical protein
MDTSGMNQLSPADWIAAVVIGVAELPPRTFQATARSGSPGQSPPEARALVPVVGRRSAVGDHAAASIDGHVPQAADRLA